MDDRNRGQTIKASIQCDCHKANNVWTDCTSQKRLTTPSHVCQTEESLLKHFPSQRLTILESNPHQSLQIGGHKEQPREIHQNIR